SGRYHFETDGRGIRADHAGRDRRQHVGVHRTQDRLDRPAENCDLVLYLGRLPRAGLPAHDCRMARPQSGADDCRGTRILGDHMAGAQASGRHPDRAAMKLLIAGVSHKTAPVEVRERLAFAEASLPAALAELQSRDGVQEAMILSTCNRVEITLTTD